MSLRCWRAKGMPMMLIAHTSAEPAWARAISQPKRTSQITFRTSRVVLSASSSSTISFPNGVSVATPIFMGMSRPLLNLVG